MEKDYTRFVSEIQSMSVEQIESLLDGLPKNEGELMRIYFNLKNTTPKGFEELLKKLKVLDGKGEKLTELIHYLVSHLQIEAKRITEPESDGTFNPFN